MIDEDISNRTPRVCLHITKTAGGTLKAALAEATSLKVAFVYNADDRERVKNSSPQNLDLIFGHMPFGVHHDLNLPETTRYMCFMRHPVTRTISHYYHLRNVDKGPIGEKIRESQNINDFFKNYQHWEFSNFMTKLISGIGAAQPPRGATIYKDAVNNLETKFDFVGFQEFLPISMRKFSIVLKSDIKLNRDVNIGKYSFESIAEETIERIYELNAQDIRLYKHTLNLFL